jgi:hypothetical protein
MHPQMPLISRHLVSTTAHTSDANSGLDGLPNNGGNVGMGRTNTQGKLKTNMFLTNNPRFQTNTPVDINNDENLQRAKSEISLLRKELKMKNNELQKLKKIEKVQKK